MLGEKILSHFWGFRLTYSTFTFLLFVAFVQVVSNHDRYKVTPADSYHEKLVEYDLQKKHYNIIRFGGKYYALAWGEGPFSIDKVYKKKYTYCFAGDTIDEVKRLVDQSIKDPVLMEEGYKGFNIVWYGNRYYGLAQAEGAFDIDKVNTGKYRQCFTGSSTEEVRHIIDESPGLEVKTGRE